MSQIDIEEAADRILQGIYGYNEYYTKSSSQIAAKTKHQPFDRIIQMDLIAKSGDAPLYLMGANSHVNMGVTQIVNGKYNVPSLDQCRSIIDGDEPIDGIYRCVTDNGDIVAFSTFSGYIAFIYSDDGSDYSVLFGTDDEFINIVRKGGELFFAN